MVHQASELRSCLDGRRTSTFTGCGLLQRIAISMGNIITGTAQSYDNGMRAYYFALGAVTWVVSPIVFMMATTGVVALLLHRQTRSRTDLALREIASARAEAAVLKK